MIKIILITVFLLIIFSLGSALYHLVKHKEDASSQRTAKALTFRIGISIVLFIFVIILVATGIIKPHGIGSRIHPQTQTTPENSK
ncbi:MAG: twin transmembrane helix small protein [Methyloglobulus sp.]|nr:twin transmembrane helix small protein [Methyloglobulus sp.]